MLVAVVRPRVESGKAQFSALPPPKADKQQTSRPVRFVPDSDMAGVKPFAYSRRPVRCLAGRSLRREI